MSDIVEKVNKYEFSSKQRSRQPIREESPDNEYSAIQSQVNLNRRRVEHFRLITFIFELCHSNSNVGFCLDFACYCLAPPGWLNYKAYTVNREICIFRIIALLDDHDHIIDSPDSPTIDQPVDSIRRSIASINNRPARQSPTISLNLIIIIKIY